jgi:hypothetical protein
MKLDLEECDVWILMLTIAFVVSDVWGNGAPVNVEKVPLLPLYLVPRIWIFAIRTLALFLLWTVLSMTNTLHTNTIRLEGPMFDSVGSLVLSTECLLIWMVLDLNTQVRAAVYSLSVYKLLVKTKNYPPVVSGRGGWLPGPTG